MNEYQGIDVRGKHDLATAILQVLIADLYALPLHIYASEILEGMAKGINDHVSALVQDHNDV